MPNKKTKKSSKNVVGIDKIELRDPKKLLGASRRLIDLLKEWDYALEDYKRISTRMSASLKELSSLNVTIYTLCAEEGFDIKDLQLNHRTK